MLKFIKNHIKSTNKLGFTLSEVMITLTVLGVIGAVLIPTIMGLVPDNNKIMFKKAYRTLETVIESMINDETNYPSSMTIEIPAASGTYYKKYFNYTAVTENGTRNKFAFLLVNNLNTVDTITLPSVSNGPAMATFTTSDGIRWYIYMPVSDTTTDAETSANASNPAAVQFPICTTTACYTTLITMDVNGTTKGPNCSEDSLVNPLISACTSNETPDTYRVQVRYDGRLLVPTTDSTATEILSNPTENLN